MKSTVLIVVDKCILILSLQQKSENMNTMLVHVLHADLQGIRGYLFQSSKCTLKVNAIVMSAILTHFSIFFPISHILNETHRAICHLIELEYILAA